MSSFYYMSNDIEKLHEPSMKNGIHREWVDNSSPVHEPSMKNGIRREWVDNSSPLCKAMLVERKITSVQGPSVLNPGQYIEVPLWDAEEYIESCHSPFFRKYYEVDINLKKQGILTDSD